MNLYPLTFHPILKQKVWGGRALERFGKQLPANVSIGESWELTDLPPSVDQGKSIISNGPLAGLTLSEAIEQSPSIMGSTPLVSGGFPLLIKFLDANDNLSVQVHPDEAYVASHPEAHLKSEAWIILDAAPKGCIYVGLAQGTTEADLRTAMKNDSVSELLRAIEVRKGECYYLPSGTCHALGAGVLVAEVQTPSDTTFRLWDWGRTGRTMHVEQAMQCIDFHARDLHCAQPDALKSGSFLTTHYIDTPFFSIERIEATEDAALPMIVDDAPAVLMVVEGHANIEHEQPIDATTGTTVLLPAGLSNAIMHMPKGTAVLRFDLPPRKVIA